MKYKLYFDVVHNAHNGREITGLCTTLASTRWRIPIYDYDNLTDMVNRINAFQAETDGVPLYYPTEGYSCTVDAPSEEIISFLIGELEQEPGITDHETGLREIQDTLYSLLRFLEFNTIPDNKYINITLTFD